MCIIFILNHRIHTCREHFKDCRKEGRDLFFYMVMRGIILFVYNYYCTSVSVCVTNRTLALLHNRCILYTEE